MLPSGSLIDPGSEWSSGTLTGYQMFLKTLQFYSQCIFGMAFYFFYMGFVYEFTAVESKKI